MMITREQVLAEFRWTKPVEIKTSRGPRIKRTAPVTPEASEFFRLNGAQLSAMGIYHAHKWKQEGYEYTWWEDIPKEAMAKRDSNHELSRATDADIDIPCPDGRAYMPFQRAGIKYILSVFGDVKL